MTAYLEKLSMTAQPMRYVTEEEYLQRERASTSKHEYYGGHIYAMAGASEEHNLIAMNIAALLRARVRGSSCRAYPSDMRVKVLQTGLNTYPDFTVVCDPPEFVNPEKRDTLTNPSLIIEILSPSTESYDRGEKFQHYRTIDTLQEYILVAQNKYRIERFVRHASNEWILSDVAGIEAVLPLSTLQIQIPLAEIYEQVTLRPDITLLREVSSSGLSEDTEGGEEGSLETSE
jgi:Uma2 family endonuclease